MSSSEQGGGTEARKSGRTRRKTQPVLTCPSAERLLEGVLALGRDAHLGMDERELAGRFLRTVEELFPGRAVAVRLEPAGASESARPAATETRRHALLSKGAALTAAAASGPIVLKRTSLGKTQLAPEVVATGRVRLAAACEPAIEGAPAGFSIPLVAGGELYGALDVAYPFGTGDDPRVVDFDERTLIPVANQLSVALRNVRLHGEAEVLRDYLGKLVDHASALIIGVDPEWRITVVNRAVAQLLGVSPTDVIGRDLRDIIPEARGRLTGVFARALAGQDATIDIEIKTPRGAIGTFWHVAAIGSRRPGVEGSRPGVEGSRPGVERVRQVEAIVAVGQDLTHVKSLERQVIQAEKLATLGQLAAGVVHELNNPLTSITVYADFLLKKLERAAPFEPADVEKLRRILEGADRILNFSRDLVQYAKPTSEHLDVLQLNDVVRQSLSFCEHVLRKASVKLTTDLAEELPPLYAVRGQLQQVVINLVTNAVHALPSGAGRVTVRTWCEESGHIGIAIGDNGVGIKKEHLERIFEPFFTTKTDGKGTGLGLSIVRNIVERHHGTIGVTSTPGAGTTFRLMFPTHLHQPDPEATDD